MKVVPINQRMVNASVVEMLRDALTRAERGEIVGLTIVGVMNDGCVIDGWSAGDYNKYVMLGGISALNRDYLQNEIQAR